VDVANGGKVTVEWRAEVAEGQILLSPARRTPMAKKNTDEQRAPEVTA